MKQGIPLRDGLYRIGPHDCSLLGSRCTGCGHLHFPSAATCVACRGNDLQETDLGARGTLFCETTVHVGTARFPAGYSVGYVSLAGGLRVFTPLRPVEGKRFEVGMAMRLEVVALWREDDTDILAHRFHPA